MLVRTLQANRAISGLAYMINGHADMLVDGHCCYHSKNPRCDDAHGHSCHAHESGSESWWSGWMGHVSWDYWNPIL